MSTINRLLIDTDILIDIAQGNPIAISRLSAEQKIYKPAVSVITKMELIWDAEVRKSSEN